RLRGSQFSILVEHALRLTLLVGEAGRSQPRIGLRAQVLAFGPRSDDGIVTGLQPRHHEPELAGEPLDLLVTKSEAPRGPHIEGGACGCWHSSPTGSSAAILNAEFLSQACHRHRETLEQQ